MTRTLTRPSKVPSLELKLMARMFTFIASEMTPVTALTSPTSSMPVKLRLTSNCLAEREDHCALMTR